jgi:V/A-type H+-transporting ATPase subunit F
LRLLVRPGDALGLRLAGVEVEEVGEGAERARLSAALGDAKLAVVGIEAQLLAALGEEALERPGPPVILPFALPRRMGDAGGGAQYVSALIRRAIGYHIKLGGSGEP